MHARGLSGSQEVPHADPCPAGVGDFVARVHQLGTGTAGGGTTATATAPALHESAPTTAMAADPGASQPQRSAEPEPEEPPHTGPLTTELLQSPSALLLHCQAQLQQGCLAPVPGRSPGQCGSPGVAAARPATGSPSRAKPLVQVKAEQDRALQHLRDAPRPFRASPLPLSTMEPRFEQQQKQADAARQASHAQRRQQLMEQQRSFGFEARAADRAQRRQLLQGAPLGAGAGPQQAATDAARPTTPAFHAQPVPVATTEVRLGFVGEHFIGVWASCPITSPAPWCLLPLQARYALLAAELCLHHRTVKGRGLASPHMRPATAAAAVAAAAPAATRPRPATAAAAAAAFGVATEAPLNAISSAAEPALEHLPARRPAPSAAMVHMSPPVVAEQPSEAAADSPAAAAAYSASLPADSYSDFTDSRPGSAGTLDAEQSAGVLSNSTSSGDAVVAQEQEAEAAPSLEPPLERAAEERAAEERAAEQEAAVSPSPAVLLELPVWCAAGSDAQVEQQLQPAEPTAQPAEEESSRPEVRRLGTRSSSAGDGFVGCAALEPGIAVPVLRGDWGSMAGASAELAAAEGLPASTAAERCGAAGSRSAATRRQLSREERRDTPPQHIAARHKQAEAVARREVLQLLQRRGDGIVRLVQGGGS